MLQAELLIEIEDLNHSLCLDFSFRPQSDNVLDWVHQSSICLVCLLGDQLLGFEVKHHQLLLALWSHILDRDILIRLEIREAEFEIRSIHA